MFPGIYNLLERPYNFLDESNGRNANLNSDSISMVALFLLEH